jgi:hypothetical protein
MPLLAKHSFYQITNGSISIRSTPWCANWQHIYDHLVIQESGFIYPLVVHDLWNPHQKKWNEDLIYTFFDQHIESIITNTPIIQSNEEDMLCWDLSPLGKCTTKSAYFLCLQTL